MSNHKFKEEDIVHDLEQFINKQSEIIQLFRQGMDSTKEIVIFFLGKNFEYLYYNTAHKELVKNAFGTDIAIGKKFLGLIPESEREKFVSKFNKGLAGETFSSKFEFGFSEPQYLESYINPIQSSAGTIIGISVYSINVTSTVHSKQLFLENSARFRILTDNFPYEFVVLDPDFRILYMNKLALTRLKMKAGEVAGQHLYEIDHPSITTQTRSFQNKICNAGESVNITVKLNEMGNEKVFRINYIPVAGENGEIREIYRILIDVTQISQNENRLRALSNQLEKLREEERHRISRDIHDDLGQILTALKMDLVSLQKKYRLNTEYQEELAPVIGLVDAAIDSARRVSFELRPGILDQTGLIPAVEWLINQSKKHSRIEYQVSLPDTGILEIDTEKSVAVYRILQEILTNISRHADATKVNISLSADGKNVKLLVSDNGKGFDFDSHAESLGILGMKERARMQNGALVVQSQPSEGTFISLTIPHS